MIIFLSSFLYNGDYGEYAIKHIMYFKEKSYEIYT